MRASNHSATVEIDGDRELELRLEKLEMELKLLRAAQQAIDEKWVSLSEMEARFGITARQARGIIKASIDKPADSPLVNGVHYLWPNVGKRGGLIKVRPSRFLPAIGISVS